MENLNRDLERNSIHVLLLIACSPYVIPQMTRHAEFLGAISKMMSHVG